MQNAFAGDVSQRISAQVDSGAFANPDEVMRAALTALELQQKDWAAIQAGIEDMEAGRYQPFAEVDAELRKKHSIPRDA